MNLNLPKNSKKTRPHLRRVFAVIICALLLIIIGSGLASLTYRRDRTSHITPVTATLALRFVQTKETRKVLAKAFATTTITPQSSLSLTSFFAKTSREGVIYFNDSGDVIGFATDTPIELSPETLTTQHLQSISLPWKGQLFLEKDIKTRNDRPTFRFPWHNGEIFNLTANTTLAVTISAQNIRIKQNIGDITPSQLSPFANIGQPIASLFLPPYLASDVIKMLDIPLVYEGTRALLREGSEQGLGIQLAKDAQGYAIALRVPEANLAQKERRELIKEWSAALTSNENINAITQEIFSEIRDNNANDPRIITASEEATITQIPKDDLMNITLSINNAQTTIINRQEANSGETPSMTCGSTASNTFLTPKLLTNVLSGNTHASPTDLERLLFSLTYILWTTSETILCV